jgi:glycosyltransferase involved in cell wall biosynthesis
VTSLSIVVPVRDEPRWIGQAVADLVAAVGRVDLDEVQLIVVDDGSAAPTRDAIASLRVPFDLRVIHQPPSGRFAARRAGVELARHAWVLLIDSRVSVRPDALQYVLSEQSVAGELAVWNAHVDIELARNPYARFWNVLTELAFREYFAAPRRTSYGTEDFDRFPKGTTCFLAPRDLLLTAMGEVRSMYDTLEHANDDTLMIRAIAERQAINISPGFSCLYRSRTTLRGFLRHAMHRGGVFVDGYGRPGTRFFPVVWAFFPMSLMAAGAAVRRPRWAVRALLAAPAVLAVGLLGARRSPRDAGVVALLAPAWSAAFGAGMWRGLLRAARARRRR